MLRAAELYDESGSMTAGPGALARVAQMEIEDADHEQAAAHIQRALARLAAFPLGGTSVRLLERKIQALQQSLQR
jgi:hypothetical protein